MKLGLTIAYRLLWFIQVGITLLSVFFAVFSHGGIPMGDRIFFFAIGAAVVASIHYILTDPIGKKLAEVNDEQR